MERNIFEIKKKVVITTPEEFKRAVELVNELKIACDDFTNAERKKITDACPHSRKTGLQYMWHDSHNRYYENKCLDCGLILEKQER